MASHVKIDNYLRNMQSDNKVDIVVKIGLFGHCSASFITLQALRMLIIIQYITQLYSTKRNKK